MSEAIQTTGTKAITKDTATQLKDLLIANQKAISSLVPKHLTPERLMRVAVNCVAKTPGLQKCTPTSLLRSVMAAAEVGLEPGGVLGHMYLVPFGSECTPIIGYRGLKELALRSGQVADVYAEVVYEKDYFKHTKGLNPTLEHEPHLDGDAGAVRLAYCVVKFVGGGHHIEVMTKTQIDKVRAVSKASGSGPWANWYEEMCRKTVARRGLKWSPLSSEHYQRAMEMDNDDHDLDGAEATAESVVSGVTNIKDKVARTRKMPMIDVTDPLPEQLPEGEAPPA